MRQACLPPWGRKALIALPSFSRSAVNSTAVGARSEKGISAKLASVRCVLKGTGQTVANAARKSLNPLPTFIVPLVSTSSTTDQAVSSLLNLLE